MAITRASLKSIFFALTICALTASATDRRTRHVESLTSGNNEFDTGKKSSHRLVGGHVRLETTTISSREEDKVEGNETDEATWDDGLVISSAGNGKEKNSKPEDDDEKKTLSQQVKEGKYGLIQNELYPSKPKRPGIISYASNPEVPKDNARNLGGLDEEEIWFAENHVLVLRGGNFPEHEKDEKLGGLDNWSPIDDYKAPKRQVKIPPTPKVPPPFPVQLTENGPVQIIGFNGTSDEFSNDYDANSPRDKEFSTRESPFPPKNETTKDLTSLENTTKKLNDQDKKIKAGHVPPREGVIGPFFPSLPPGAVFVVPPPNQTEYDEDDQSIYYPPPYSFYYKQDNSTPVPPGPLVPGIILPPPPDFFSGIEEKKVTKESKYTKRPSTTARPRVSTFYPSRKSSLKSYKSTTSSSLPGKISTPKYTSRGASFTMKPINVVKYRTTTGRSIETPRIREKTVTILETTTPSVERSTTLRISTSYPTRPNVILDSVEKTTKTSSASRWIPSVSSDPVPLVNYYSSSTPSTVDEPVEATPVKSVLTSEKQRGTTHQASYYFYEEANVATTPNPLIYYRATTEEPYYRLQEPVPTRETSDYVESIETLPKTSHYQTENSPTPNSLISRIKGQRTLNAGYYEDATVRPRPRLQSFYTTPAPLNRDEERYDYEGATKSKPIYQYSYESAEYSKRKNQGNYYKPEEPKSFYETTRERPKSPEAFDEWQDLRNENNQYDYDSGETLPVQEISPERERNGYRNRLPISYPSTTTSRPIIDVTDNPQHVYYTKQEEQLLDDVTKEYFTNFGKKIRGEKIPSTTPIYGKTRIVTERPKYSEVESFVSTDYDSAQTPIYKQPQVKVHYGDQGQPPYTYEDDTRVNYGENLPPRNPDSEWIPGYSPDQTTKYYFDYRQQDQDYSRRKLPISTPQNYGSQRLENGNGSPTNFVPLDESREFSRPRTYHGDTAVNYADPRPSTDPNAELVDTFSLPNSGNNEKKPTYFAYKLPGDGGHVYFLTPQAINQGQDGQSGYLYPKPRGRFSRQRRRGARNS